MNGQNNENNVNVSVGENTTNTQENLNNIPTAVTTNQPSPQVATVQSNIEHPEQINITSSETPSTPTPPPAPQKKGGNFKYVLTFIFLVGILAFVFFLPEISTIVESKLNNAGTTTTPQIENGTLTCTLDKSTDETDTTYQIDYMFTNQKLVTQEMITTYESVSTEFLNTKKAECDNTSTISNSVTGIQMTCSLSLGILTTSETYTLKDVNRNNLTAYVEAGGTYPEFEYQKNVYDIQTNMVKKGYDCSMSASTH